MFAFSNVLVGLIFTWHGICRQLSNSAWYVVASGTWTQGLLDFFALGTRAEAVRRRGLFVDHLLLAIRVGPWTRHIEFLRLGVPALHGVLWQRLDLGMVVTIVGAGAWNQALHGEGSVILQLQAHEPLGSLDCFRWDVVRLHGWSFVLAMSQLAPFSCAETPLLTL